jgi:hypothetical protein
MTVRAGLEVDTLTIRIPMRLQRRGGRKLIMTPEGVAAPARKPSRDETLVKALVRAHRWRRRIESGQAKSITDLAEREGVTDAYVCAAPAAHLPGAGHSGSDPGRAAAEGAEAGRDAGERAGGVGGAASEVGALATMRRGGSSRSRTAADWA